MIPPGAVLVGETDHRPIAIRAGGSSSVGEHHQGEQADRFGLVGHELDEHPGQPDRFGREVGAHQFCARGRRVAFGENDRDGGEHHIEAVWQLGGAQDAIRRVVVSQLAFRLDNALGDRGVEIAGVVGVHGDGAVVVGSLSNWAARP